MWSLPSCRILTRRTMGHKLPRMWEQLRCFASEPSESSPLLVDLDQDHGVLTLTLNRPRQRHALNRILLDELHSTLHQIQERQHLHASSPRAVLLQSHGPVFCAGHDLKELSTLSKDEQHDLFQKCASVMTMLATLSQPTICAVQGLATAAGCQLAASCDMVIANRYKASFCTPGAAALGFFCHSPAVPLVRSIGYKRSLDMLYTGRRVSAEEAHQWGLVTRLVDDVIQDGAGTYPAGGDYPNDSLVHSTALALSREIANHSAPAIQAGKRTVQRIVEAPSLDSAYQHASQAMVDNLQHGDAREGIHCFIQKKEVPVWRHE